MPNFDPGLTKRRVSEALSLPAHPGRQLLRDALDAIDSVHVDGNLSRIPVTFTEARTPHGRYDGSCITISVHTPVPRITLVHEIAHFLTQAVKNFRSEWWEAVRKSRVYREMNLQCVTAGIDVSPPVASNLGYLRNFDELWARSYSQFIVRKSGRRDLLDEFERRRDVYPGEYWEDDDFEPIDRQLSALIRKKGWEL